MSAFAPSELRRDSLCTLAGLPSRSSARQHRAKAGADDQDRTGDLVLTKDALCQLSYIGLRGSLPRRLAATADKSAVSIRQRATAWGSPPSRSALRWRTFAWLANRSSRPRWQVSEGWSGRRGSNPRPTAWKAVTLPLSYSRLRASLRCARVGASAGKPALLPPRTHTPERTLRLGLAVRLRAMRFGATAFACWPAQTKLVGQSSKRSLVAREGFEPSKPLGRQIYSLLRLTASLPRRYVRARIADGTAARPVSSRTLLMQHQGRARCHM